MATPVTSSNESASLSRDLSEFLIEFSIALHKHAIYPEGHPLLASSETRLALGLAALLETRGTLSLGVARNQLVIEGVATDPVNPLLRELAQRLHRHHLGAVKFARGVRDAEVADLLRTLAVEGSRVETPLGLGPAEALRRWEHIRLFALTFEHLELLDDDKDEQKKDESELRDGQRFRAAQLWIGLARAALASELGGGEGEHTPSAADPTVIAKAIDEHQREQAYDQVIVGYLLQISTELQRGGGGSETASLRRRVSRLVSSLNPETLRKLLEMGGDAMQRKQFVLESIQGMAVDAIVELAKAAADSSGQTISHSLIRMLNKLAVHAERGPETLRAGAEHALRDNVRRLVEGWELGDPNPDAYRKALEAMSRHSTSPFRASGDADAEPERLIEMSLELGVVGESTVDAIDNLIHSGRVGEVAAMLESETTDAATRDAIWAHLATPDVLRTMLEAQQPDLPTIARLAEQMGVAAIEVLLEGVEKAEETSARWKLLDLLAQFGAEVGERAAKRLQDAPWYVQRNLLVLMGRLPELPAGFSPELFATHSEPRVRREAIKLQLRSPIMRERAIITGLRDREPRILQLALSAAVEECPLPAAPELMALLRSRSLDADLRVLAIRALACVKLPNVLEELLRYVSGRRKLLGLGSPRLPAKSPVMLAALSGLAAHWSAHTRARGILRLASTSADPEIRAAATLTALPSTRPSSPTPA